MSEFHCKPDIIAKLRKEQGYKQEPFANLVSLDVQTLRKMEKGGSVRRTNAVKVAKALGVATSVIGGVDSAKLAGISRKGPRIPNVHVPQDVLAGTDELAISKHTAYPIDVTALEFMGPSKGSKTRWVILREGSDLSADAMEQMRHLEKIIDNITQTEQVSETLSALLDEETSHASLERALQSLADHGWHVLVTGFNFYYEALVGSDLELFETVGSLLILAPQYIDEVLVTTPIDKRTGERDPFVDLLDEDERSSLGPFDEVEYDD